MSLNGVGRRPPRSRTQRRRPERPSRPLSPQSAGASESGRDDRAPVIGLIGAVLVALMVHLFLPNGQTPEVAWTDALAPWLHPYPVLLEILLAAALLLAVAQWVWRPLRPWVCHYAPLLAAAVLAFCAGT